MVKGAQDRLVDMVDRLVAIRGPGLPYRGAAGVAELELHGAAVVGGPAGETAR